MDSYIPVELIGSSGEFYPGFITGYNAPNQLIFRFVGEDSPGFPEKVVVSPCHVRKPPKQSFHEVPVSEVSIGDEVDVLAGKPVADGNLSTLYYQPGELPPSWWPARVTKQRGDFIVIDFEESHNSTQSPLQLDHPRHDGVTENNQVRPRSSQQLLSESDFFSYVLDIPRELVDLFKEPVSIQHLVKACGQPMLICPVTPEMQLPDEFANHDLSDETKVSFLLMCTSREAIFKAETLGYEVVKMLRQKITILHQISEISRKLKETNSTKSEDLILERFAVSPDLVGQSIGAGGANIRRARMIDGVVSVLLDPETCTFKVCGKTKEAVSNAKKVLEYATEVMQVPQEYVSRIIGIKNRHIQALVDRVGLAKIRVQAAEEATVPNCVPFAFTGTRSAINDAKLLINFNIENLKEIDELQASLPAHGRNRFMADGDGHYNKGRDRSSKSMSESVKGGGRRYHPFQPTDSGQATDSGVNTATTFNGDTGGNGNGNGRTGTDTAAEQSDATASSYRQYPPRPANRSGRRNFNNPSARNGGKAALSPQRQNSLPPPAPKSNGSQQPGYPMSDTNSGPANKPRGGNRRRPGPRTVNRSRENSQGGGAANPGPRHQRPINATS